MTTFRASVDAFLDELFRLDPVLATEAGMHAHDGRWPDLSPTGRAELLAAVERWEREWRAMEGDALEPEDRIDRQLLLRQLDSIRFSTVELRELDWDPLAWVYLVGGGLFPLVAREFAPLDVRLRSLAARLSAVPALLATARSRLGSFAARPVSLLHAETAIGQLAGVGELVEDALRLAQTAAVVDASVNALLPGLREAAGEANAALEAFAAHLGTVVLPMAEGEGRLGRELFAAKLERTLMSPHPDPEELAGQARRQYGTVRAEMVRIARELWPTWMPETEMPSAATPADQARADEDVVRGILDAVGRQHPAPPDVLDVCRAELARIEAFCRERDVVGLPDDPLAIEWTPAFLRSVGGAMLIPPGPLDRGEKAFFAVTPIPEDWGAERVESYLREDNDRMLRLLTIHEGVPGHYLQLAWANRCASLPRVVFWSGVFAEGWAVYVEQVLMDLGYAADDPALMLTHWKLYLRSIVNALIDVGIHTSGMTEEEALELMVHGGFQEEAEARSKYTRARLTSTQLSTYFVGALEMWRLERDRRLALAKASGDPRGADAVPEERIVGGLGSTPGFAYREHLERVLSYGSPPIPILRSFLLDE